MHDDDFWREYEEHHDYEYIQEHKDDYSGLGGLGRFGFWVVVWIIAIFIGVSFADSPGILLFFLAMAFSFSFCL